MTRTAIVAGVGPGLGESVARKFADEGCAVGLFARSAEYLDDLEIALRDRGEDALAVPTDVTRPAEVEAGFEAVRGAFGPVDVLVHNAGNYLYGGLLDVTPSELEEMWRVAAYGGFLCAQEAVPDMLGEAPRAPEHRTASGDSAERTPAGNRPETGDAEASETPPATGEAGADGGTVISTGATSSIRGPATGLAFGSAKFAVRGMAESMARDLGHEGIHVAHVVVDGMIDMPTVREELPDREAHELLDSDEIADTYWHLVEQDRSAWTLELDLRPHVEEF